MQSNTVVLHSPTQYIYMVCEQQLLEKNKKNYTKITVYKQSALL